MDKDIIVSIIGLVSGLLGGGVIAAYVSLRKLKSDIEVTSSQAEVNETQSDLNVSQTAKNLFDVVERQNQQLRADRDAWEVDRKNYTDMLLKQSAITNELADKVKELDSAGAQMLQMRAKDAEQIEHLTAQQRENMSQIDIMRGEISQSNTKIAEYKGIIQVCLDILADNGLIDKMPEELRLRLGTSFKIKAVKK